MIYVVSLAFVPVRTIKASVKRFDETIGLRKEDYKHVLVDQMWPRDRNDMIRFLVDQDEAGKTVLYPGKNLGLAGGVNYAMEKMGVTDKDIVMIFDPDNFPMQKRWGFAMKQVLEDPTVGWVSLWNCATDAELKNKQYTEKVINGHKVCALGAPIMNSVCGLKASYLKKAGGAREPNHYYGGFECGMWASLKEQKLDWVFLKDFHEDNILNVDPNFLDKDYQEYKYATTHGGEEQVEFREWLVKHERT